MVELGARSQGNVARIAVVVDVRGRRFFDNLRELLADLEAKNVTRRIVFLESSDEALVRRFESVRRPHPLQGDGRIVDGIDAERELLRELRGDADLVIDTSSLNVHELRAKMDAQFAGEEEPELRATVMSFGFKYGLPVDADLVVDRRFLPNPHWVPELRPFTGLNEEVSAYGLQPARRQGVPRPLHRAAPAHRRRLPPRGQALCDHRGRLHRRQAPLGRHLREARRPPRLAGRGDRGRPPGQMARVTGRAALRRAGCAGSPPRDAARPAEARGGKPRRRGAQPKVVALGGGMGLSASLAALRRITGDLTAVVTVADDGGSSGRLRDELGAPPPGDLRKALAALCRPR